MNNYRILVTGATGYVGGRLVPELIKEGYYIRCLARNPEKVKGRNWKNIDVVKGDVLKPETLAPALEGIDIAYYLIHAMGKWGDFKERDAKSAHNFAEAAKKAGIKRIIYLGGLAYEKDNLSPHLKSRHETGKILASTGIAVTEFRASIIIGSGSASFEITRDLVKNLPFMITPKWVNSLCEPIAIKDVIYYLKECLNFPKTEGEILEIGGGEVLTYLDMMRKTGEVMSRKFYVIKVPVLTPRLSAYWLNLVTSVPMSLAFPLVEGLKNDTVCKDGKIKELMPHETMKFKESVKKALEEERKDFLASRWNEAYTTPLISSKQKVSHEVLRCERVVFSFAKKEKIFQVIKSLGGNRGWIYGNFLLWSRGVLDRLIGGVGTIKGRRHPFD